MKSRHELALLFQSKATTRIKGARSSASPLHRNHGRFILPGRRSSRLHVATAAATIGFLPRQQQSPGERVFWSGARPEWAVLLVVVVAVAGALLLRAPRLLCACSAGRGMQNPVHRGEWGPVRAGPNHDFFYHWLAASRTRPVLQLPGRARAVRVLGQGHERLARVTRGQSREPDGRSKPRTVSRRGRCWVLRPRKKAGYPGGQVWKGGATGCLFGSASSMPAQPRASEAPPALGGPTMGWLVVCGAGRVKILGGRHQCGGADGGSWGVMRTGLMPRRLTGFRPPVRRFRPE